MVMGRKSKMSALKRDLGYLHCGHPEASKLLDRAYNLGYKYAKLEEQNGKSKGN